MSIDVTDADFETKVVERSKEVPVVLDLWAPWCGPCRQLAPVLENLEEEYAGKFELAKINIDENPQVATALRAQSIPLVVGFRDGKAINQFLGVQPAGAIKQFLDSLIPSELEQLIIAAGDQLEAGNTLEARQLLEQARAIDSKHDAVRFCSASLNLAEGHYSEAIEILNSIPSNGHDDVAAMLSQARLLSAADENISEPEDEDDLASVIAYGQALAGNGDHEKALDTLLAAVKKDPGFDDGAARKAMLDLFGVLGNANPLTRDYRSKLSSALF